MVFLPVPDRVSVRRKRIGEASVNKPDPTLSSYLKWMVGMVRYRRFGDWLTYHQSKIKGPGKEWEKRGSVKGRVFMDIHDRIAKLLALANSPVEAEAQAALLKAKELMMKHKLDEGDMDRARLRKVKEINSGITCSRRRDHWIPALAEVIAKNHCCQKFVRRQYGKQTVTVCFWGFEEDVDLCKRIFDYALSSIQCWIAEKEKRDLYVSAELRRDIRYSYAGGYIDGIAVAYQKQSEANREWGLVAVVPNEVKELAATLRTIKFNGTANRHAATYQKGYEDGCEFDIATKLEVKETKNDPA